MKRMIFHIPNYLDPNIHSGSQIRPRKMIQAFKDIGYEVDVVSGYVHERRNSIYTIKKNIKSGIKYEFLYSESSTVATALTEKHHLPIAPFLDFNFFSFCKKNGIRIGLFYRDIYWIFDSYKNSMSYFKYKFAVSFYKFDLIYYSKFVDILYLPSRQMFDYIPFPSSFTKSVNALPPGIAMYKNVKSKNALLSFIYVGGLSDLYDLTLFTKTISLHKDVKFTLCTRENEWQKEKNKYINYMHTLTVVHKNSDELASMYEANDIAIYFVKPDILWSFALGIKLFEYIAHKKPIIAIENTAVGDFVKKNDIGWVIEYNKDQLDALVNCINNDRTLIDEKIENMEAIISKNTWKARAEQVKQELINA